MRHKIISLVVSALVGLGAVAVASAQSDAAPSQDSSSTASQQQATPMGRGHRTMDPDRELRHLTRQLDLTADQQNQIRPMLLDRQKKMQALWQDASLSRADLRSKAMEVQQDTHSRIETVLDEQQKQKFEAMQERMRNRRQGMRGSTNDPSAASPQPQ